MVTIAWADGDMFSFDKGYGIVLKGGKESLIVTGGGRSPYKISVNPIPLDALPRLEKTPMEITMALLGGAVATKTLSSLNTNNFQ